MGELVLVGDIGGTNSRFGAVAPGETRVRDIATLRNDRFGSLEEAISHYVADHAGHGFSAAAIAVAAPTAGETIGLTNRNWRFTRESLRKAAGARRFLLLNDFEALAHSLPHLGPDEVIRIGGEEPHVDEVKIVLGPGTGLGMATLAPRGGGRWLALAGEVGHTHLPVATREEFEWRQKMTRPGETFTSEDALSGGGLLRMYRAIAPQGPLSAPEEVLAAGLSGADRQAQRTVNQFITWLARVAGDAAMAMQAKGGVYLAGGIAPALIEKLKSSAFRAMFEDKGKIAYVMKPIPVYVIVDKFPALKGCAAAIAE